MMMHKTDAKNEAGIPPPPELVTRMGQLIDDMAKAGIVLAGEGLGPSSKGVRLNFANGKRTITDGPFIKGNELISSFTMLKVKSMADAIDWATRYASIVGDSEIDIRPVHEPWDLGIMPKPEGLTTTRYLWVHKSDQNSEAGIKPPPEVTARLARLKEEMTKTGVLLASDRLAPSSKGVRLNFKGGKATMTDGPFAESKELIAGYLMVQVKSIADTLEWADRFVQVIGDVELDLRPLEEPTCY